MLYSSLPILFLQFGYKLTHTIFVKEQRSGLVSSVYKLTMIYGQKQS